MKNMKVAIATIEYVLDMPCAIAAFRGMFIAGSLLDDVLLHGHDGGKIRQGYPLVQYYKKGNFYGVSSPFSVAKKIGLFSSLEKGKMKEMKVRDYFIGEIPVARDFQVTSFMLNDKALKRFRRSSDTSEFEAAIKRAIKNMYFSLWMTDVEAKDIEVSVLKWTGYQEVHKNRNVNVFDISFRSNHLLPTPLGIGRAAAFGFGRVSTKATNKHPSR